MPTHNRARYLTEAIESVLAQTFRDFEVLVCDNASTDATGDVIRHFTDPRLRTIRHASNIGMSANWRHAVAASTGMYCGILGDDDRWDPRFLERLTVPLDQDKDVDVAFCDHWIMNAEGQELAADTEACTRRFRGDLRPGTHRPFAELALRRQALLTTASLFRRRSLLASGALEIEPAVLSAYYVFGRLTLAGGGAAYVPDRLAYYRAHSLSASETMSVSAFQALQWACARLSPEVPPGAAARWIRESWVEALMGEGVLLLRQGDRRGAVRAYARALRLAPCETRAWIRLIVASLGIYHWSCALRARSASLIGRLRRASTPLRQRSP